MFDLVVSVGALGLFCSAADRIQVVAQQADCHQGCAPLGEDSAVRDAEHMPLATRLVPKAVSGVSWPALQIAALHGALPKADHNLPVRCAILPSSPVAHSSLPFAPVVTVGLRQRGPVCSRLRGLLVASCSAG